MAMGVLEASLLTLYTGSMLYVVLFSLGQMHLAYLYTTRRGRQARSAVEMKADRFPFVTVQVPLYNERLVADRLIDAVMMLDWPSDAMEVQVLDDSNDGTAEIVDRKIAQYGGRSFALSHIRRTDRKGYKAGALQHGLDRARGAFIAIFDADFVPAPDFLKRVMPHFAEHDIGMVQVRWGHLNRGYSLLTRLQAFGLDGHFTVEQSGRQAAGSFINFNGTAGVWRKKCIDEAGGWHDDTIAEDLDLSYRAQMLGWQFRYLEDYLAPAELPIRLSAVKSQQFRWTKGGAETARKHLIKVLRSDLGWVQKLHAFFHLTNSTNFLFILIASVVSVPMLFVKSGHPEYQLLFNAMGIFVLGFVAISLFYWTAARHGSEKGSRRFIRYFPPFIMLYMGLALHNSHAVVQGLMGRKTPFVRTPKYNITGRSFDRPLIVTGPAEIGLITVFEGVLCLYFLFGIAAAIYLKDYGLVPFHLMLAAGYGMVVYYALRHH